LVLGVGRREAVDGVDATTEERRIVEALHLLSRVDIGVDVREFSFDIGVDDELVSGGVILNRRENDLSETAVAGNAEDGYGNGIETKEAVGGVDLVIDDKGISIAGGGLAEGRLYGSKSA